MGTVNMVQELRIQAHWREIEKKQQKIRTKWFHRNRELLDQSILPQEASKYEKTQEKIEELIEMRQIRFQNEKRDRYKFQIKKDVIPPYDENQYLEPVEIHKPMLPVDKEIEKEIYSGISHNDEGRKRYLKLRNKLPVEERYYEPVTEYHEYGWNVANRFEPIERYPKTTALKDCISGRNGALKADSPYWKIPFSDSPPDYLS